MAAAGMVSTQATLYVDVVGCFFYKQRHTNSMVASSLAVGDVLTLRRYLYKALPAVSVHNEAGVQVGSVGREYAAKLNDALASETLLSCVVSQELHLKDRPRDYDDRIVPQSVLRARITLLRRSDA
jgi:hypothetical protein